MAFLRHHEITTSYSELFGLEINNGYLAYTYPVTDHLALGFDWFSIGHKDTELDYGFNKFNLGAAYRFLKRASIGATIKFLNTSTSFDGQSLGKGNGVTGDLGGLYRLNDRLSVGFVVNNVFDADITYDNGTQARFYDSRAKLGVGYAPSRNTQIGLDIGEQLNIGGEYFAKDLLALRAGYQRDLSRDPENVYSFGMGLRYGLLQFDYSLTAYPYLSETSRFSLSLFFNFGYSLVAVNNVTAAGRPALFPSLWASYQMAPFLSFELENKDDRPLQCNWEVDIDGFMSSPSQGEIVLRPQETEQIYVTGRFSDRFLSNKSDAVRSGTITLTYTKGREEKVVEEAFDIFVYENGAIDWNESTAWAASFVTPHDPAIREFASMLLDAGITPDGSSKLLANVLTAMSIFNGINAHGIRYLKDPNNPYDSIQSRISGLDNIQLPAVLLKSKAGDCDDLTVLFCSLLESVGIETVVLDVPGHLFMMFDSGIPSAYRISAQLDDRLLVDYQGRVFIPVEVTSIAEGFHSAWSAGAEKYYRWERLEELRLIDLRKSWKIYPSMPVAHRLPDEFENTTTQDSLVRDDWAALAVAQQEYVNENFRIPISGLTDDPTVLNRRAVAEIFDGNLARGESMLRAALKRDASHQEILVNLANVLSLLGKSEESMQLYGEMDQKQLTAEAAGNHIIAACLAVDSGPADSSGPGAVLNPLVSRYREEIGLQLDEKLVFRCYESRVGGRELADCMKAALDRALTDKEVVQKGDIENSESIREELRLFQWVY
jgi:hypothetical protein